jgi:putative transcriptional regulator
MLWLGVPLVPPMLFDAALSKPEDARPGASLAGQLPVATPEMSGPRFRHTVILMVQHNKDGALGTVINRPASELPVTKLLEALGLDSKGSVRLFGGGSVQLDACFIVHSADYIIPAPPISMTAWR